MAKKKALIMVDLQNDFCTGGSLAVPEGEKIIQLANQLQPYFELVIATQDWHPQAHMSFASNHPNFEVGDVLLINDFPQVLWPDHCVQHSKGAEFYPTLDTSRIDKIIQKGIDIKIDSYSAFFDNAHKRATGLAEYLRSQDVEDIYLLGLATDYCVKYSSIDASRLGFNVFVIADACRGLDLNAGDIENAFEEMQALGAKIIHSRDIFKSNLGFQQAR